MTNDILQYQQIIIRIMSLYSKQNNVIIFKTLLLVLWRRLLSDGREWIIHVSSGVCLHLLLNHCKKGMGEGFPLSEPNIIMHWTEEISEKITDTVLSIHLYRRPPMDCFKQKLSSTPSSSFLNCGTLHHFWTCWTPLHSSFLFQSQIALYSSLLLYSQ